MQRKRLKSHSCSLPSNILPKKMNLSVSCRVKPIQSRYKEKHLKEGDQSSFLSLSPFSFSGQSMYVEQDYKGLSLSFSSTRLLLLKRIFLLISFLREDHTEKGSWWRDWNQREGQSKKIFSWLTMNPMIHSFSSFLSLFFYCEQDWQGRRQG